MIKTVTDLKAFKQKALQWAAGFDAVCYLDSNGFKDKYSKFETLIAAGAKASINVNVGDAFEQLENFRRQHPGWLTGFFSYDLKNEVEDITSTNPDHLQFPDLYFFVPQYILVINGNDVDIIADNADAIFALVDQQELPGTKASIPITLQSRFSEAGYINTVEKIQQRIARGDIYVTNFCQEFYADKTTIDPVSVFSQLNQISPNPFASFFKWQDNYVLGASPERFLAKRGRQLISQPIKGTAKRGKTPTEDDAIKQQLRSHTKELQENVMIVDLVRNDLTRSAAPGTVVTEELFTVHSFSQLHQMISTIVCELDRSVSPVQAIKNTFPMGSMTGAPKLRAMKLMEQYECSKRGVYSGAIGYFSPDDDFDFNVVIRSLLYNAAEHYISFHAGSAITFHANPEKEYEECLLKAKAVMQVLGI